MAGAPQVTLEVPFQPNGPAEVQCDFFARLLEGESWEGDFLEGDFLEGASFAGKTQSNNSTQELIRVQNSFPGIRP